MYDPSFRTSDMGEYQLDRLLICRQSIDNWAPWLSIIDFSDRSLQAHNRKGNARRWVLLRVLTSLAKLSTCEHLWNLGVQWLFRGRSYGNQVSSHATWACEFVCYFFLVGNVGLSSLHMVSSPVTVCIFQIVKSRESKGLEREPIGGAQFEKFTPHPIPPSGRQFVKLTSNPNQWPSAAARATVRREPSNGTNSYTTEAKCEYAPLHYTTRQLGMCTTTPPSLHHY